MSFLTIKTLEMTNKTLMLTFCVQLLRWTCVFLTAVQRRLTASRLYLRGGAAGAWVCVCKCVSGGVS